MTGMHEIEADLDTDLPAWMADMIITELETYLAKVAELDRLYPE